MRVGLKWLSSTAVCMASKACIETRSTLGGFTLSAGFLAMRSQATAWRSDCFRIGCI